ncbi:hypothetical protein CR513_17014, partial [Mucuna pruriens]
MVVGGCSPPLAWALRISSTRVRWSSQAVSSDGLQRLSPRPAPPPSTSCATVSIKEREWESGYNESAGDMEVYVDDMVVKSTIAADHYKALGRVFQVPRKH